MTKRTKKPYTKRDLAAVSDNPEWTDAEIESAEPFTKVLPDLAASIRRARGPQKTPTKIPVSIRLNPEVVKHVRAGGPGWQSRIDDALRRATIRSVHRLSIGFWNVEYELAGIRAMSTQRAKSAVEARAQAIAGLRGRGFTIEDDAA